MVKVPLARYFGLLLAMSACSGLVCGGNRRGDSTTVDGWTFAVECSWDRNTSGGGGGRGGVSTPSAGCHGEWTVRAERNGLRKTFYPNVVIDDVSCMSAKEECASKRGTIVTAEGKDAQRIAIVVEPGDPLGIYLPRGGVPFQWSGKLTGDASSALAAMPSYDDAIERMLTHAVPLTKDMLTALDDAHVAAHRASLEKASATCTEDAATCAALESLLVPKEDDAILDAESDAKR